MNAEIDGLIEQFTGEIALRQDAITALRKLKGGDTSPPAPLPRAERVAPKRKYTKRAVPAAHQRMQLPKVPGTVKAPVQQGSITDALDRPDSVTGAMKFVIRQNPKGAFTAESLEQALKAEKDFAKLLAASSGASPIGTALSYWHKVEKIQTTAAGYVVNPEHNGFFGIT